MKYNSVTGLAEEVQSIQTDFETMLSGLDALIKSLDGQWEGKAYKEFMTAYSKLKPKLQTVSSTLEKYTSSVSNVCALESQTDKQTSLSFKSF